MLALATLYHRGKLTATDAMLLFYLFALATAGISPQYLLWPIPFLLISARLRLAAVYTGVATVFLLLYYMNPRASYFAFENLATFAPLRGLSWLLPPAVLATPQLLPWVHGLGNVVFPACALIIAFLVYRDRRTLEGRSRSGCSLRRTAQYAAPALLFGAIIVIAKWSVHREGLARSLSEIWKAIPAQYAIHVQSWSPAVIFAGDFGHFGAFNVIVLLALLAAIWCLAASWPRLERSTERRYTAELAGSRFRV